MFLWKWCPIPQLIVLDRNVANRADLAANSGNFATGMELAQNDRANYKIASDDQFHTQELARYDADRESRDANAAATLAGENQRAAAQQKNAMDIAKLNSDRAYGIADQNNARAYYNTDQNNATRQKLNEDNNARAMDVAGMRIQLGYDHDAMKTHIDEETLAAKQEMDRARNAASLQRAQLRVDNATQLAQWHAAVEAKLAQRRAFAATLRENARVSGQPMDTNLYGSAMAGVDADIKRLVDGMRKTAAQGQPQQAAPPAEPQPSPQQQQGGGQLRVLDPRDPGAVNIAQEFLRQANGDNQLARQLAAQAGYSF